MCALFVAYSKICELIININVYLTPTDWDTGCGYVFIKANQELIRSQFSCQCVRVNFKHKCTITETIWYVQNFKHLNTKQAVISHND